MGKDKCLFHYCSNEKMFNIVNTKTLRMSDVSRSNDYREMRLFYPSILYAVEDGYKSDPFDFDFDGKSDARALESLLDFVDKYINNALKNGLLTSFVVCFSEDGDRLSQWRGYADNGYGCSLGFSYRELREYCKSRHNAITIRKVDYLSKAKYDDILQIEARKILFSISNVRSDAKKMVADKELSENQIMTFMILRSLRFFEVFFYNSLRYKWDSFKEEREWRMFFNEISKDAKTLFAEKGEIPDWQNRYDTNRKVLYNTVDFYVKEDSIIPFYPIALTDLSRTPIKRFILGPKNNSYLNDVGLLFAKLRLEKPEISRSKITYR